MKHGMTPKQSRIVAALWLFIIGGVLAWVGIAVVTPPAFTREDPQVLREAAQARRLATRQLAIAADDSQKYHNNGEMHALIWNDGSRRMRWLSPGIEGNEYGWWGQTYYSARDVVVPATTSKGRTPSAAGTTQHWYSYINWYDGVPGDVIHPTTISTLEGGEVQISTNMVNLPMGLTIERHGISYSDTYKPGVSNAFVILQYRITNTGDWDGDGIVDQTQTLNNFGIGYRMDCDISDGGNFPSEGGYWQDDAVGGDETRGISYMFDGDNPGSTIDDTGAPDPGFLERGVFLFRSAAFPAMAALRVTTNKYGLKDRPYVHLPFFNKQDMGKTALFIAGAINGATRADQYDPEPFLDGTKGPRGPNVPGSPKNWYWNPPTTSLYDYRMFQSYGPWDLAPGQSIFLVQVQMVGTHIDTDQNFGGVDRLTNKPRPDDSGSKAAFDYAKALYEKWVANVGEGVMFDPTKPGGIGYPSSPNPPKAPQVKVEPDPKGGVKVSWDHSAETFLDPDYSGAEADDFQGYIVYQSARFPDRGGPNGPYVEIARFDKNVSGKWPPPDTDGDGMYDFTDKTALIGFEYWYYVAAYDKGHSNWEGTGQAIPPLETYQALNVNQNLWPPGGGYPAVVPKSPVSKGVDVTEVKVVPNPYFITAAWGTTIKFINLPTNASIDIFTITGDFVQHLDHTKPTGGPAFAEESWDLKNFNGQLVASGVYIARVTSAVNSKNVKFAIAVQK